MIDPYMMIDVPLFRPVLIDGEWKIERAAIGRPSWIERLDIGFHTREGAEAIAALLNSELKATAIKLVEQRRRPLD